jgi:hypothetical protein
MENSARKDTWPRLAEQDSEKVSLRPEAELPSQPQTPKDLYRSEVGTIDRDAVQAGALADLLCTSRSELDGLLRETQKIHERSWRVIHSLLDDLQLRAWQAVDNVIARMGGEIQERAKYELSMILENFDIQTEARLAARLDKALAKATETKRLVERELTEFAAETQKQIVEVSNRAEAEVRDREQKRAQTQNNATTKLEELNGRATEITQKIEELGDTLMNALHEHADHTLESFQSRLDQLWESAANRAEKRIADIIETGTKAVAKQVGKIVDREMLEFFIQALRHRHDGSQGDGRPDDTVGQRKQVPDLPPARDERSQKLK